MEHTTFGGSVAQRLLQSNLDPGVLRPWQGADGRSYVALNAGFDQQDKPKARVMTTNTPALLRKEEWVRLDEAVLRVARPELRIWSDLVGAGLTYTIPNGMGVTVLQHQTMTDAGEATVSMDGLRRSLRDRPVFDLAGLPLPITHADFNFSLREIMVSRQTGNPLDMTMAEQATRRVAETVDKMALGTLASYTYAGYTIYGLTNFPARMTKSMTLPTAVGWTPQTFIGELLDMIQQQTNVYFGGPWALYYSLPWARYLDDDYATTYNGDTLRTRVGKIANINYFRQLDTLTGYQLILVALRPEVIQAVTGMGITTLQWESSGGLELWFKVMCIMVPRVRANSDGITGIVHGVAS